MEFPPEPLDAPDPKDFQDEIFWLWETKKPVFDLFLILRNYLTPELMFDTTLLIRLVDKRGLDLEETLLDLPFILHGYLSIVTAKTES
jgi:hypothetical protein